MKERLLKYFYLAVMILGLSLTSFSQSYTISPNDTLITEAVPDQLTIFDIYMDNFIGSNTLIINWERISLDIPDEWDYSLCDLGTCYPGVPDGGTMYPVEPGEQGFLGFNVYPLSLSGTTTLVMRVWEESAPYEIDTLVWIINADFGTAINSEIQNSITIFPAITDQNITVSNIDEESCFLNLVDLNGKNVYHEILTAGTNSIDVAQLPAGYYIAAITSNGSVIKTQSIIIQ